MDWATADNESRQLALKLGGELVVFPLRTRLAPWAYDRELYKRRNEVKRRFRRLRGVHRIFSRCEKLTGVFLGFNVFALIFDALC